MADETKAFPTQSQRDPSKPWNQLHPLSQRSSGSELDELCGGQIEQAVAGQGLDVAITELEKEKP
jgi:hypothetical protein